MCVRGVYDLFVYAFFFRISFFAFFPPPKPFISADKHFTFRNDWLVCTHHYYATKCDFLLASWLPCHRHNTAKSTKQTTVSTRTVFSSTPRNLFTMTLVNRSCASSANLMSKPFLIYCRIFLADTEPTLWVGCKYNWHGLRNYIYIHGLALFYIHPTSNTYEEQNRFCLLSFITKSISASPCI